MMIDLLLGYNISRTSFLPNQVNNKLWSHDQQMIQIKKFAGFVRRVDTLNAWRIFQLMSNQMDRMTVHLILRLLPVSAIIKSTNSRNSDKLVKS
jgi:hypothetical protein